MNTTNMEHMDGWCWEDMEEKKGQIRHTQDGVRSQWTDEVVLKRAELKNEHTPKSQKTHQPE